MKSVRWSNIFIALCYIAAGVMFFVYPYTTEEQLCLWLGYAALAVGAIDILVYLLLPKKTAFFRNDFMIGMLLLTLGALIHFNILYVVELVYPVIAIIIMISGYRKLQDCVDSLRLRAGAGFLYFVLAFISVGFGIVIIYHGPMMEIKSLDYFLGAGLVYSGVTDLISAIVLSAKMAKHIRAEIEKKKQEEELNKPKEIVPEVEDIIEPELIENKVEENQTEEIVDDNNNNPEV